MLNKTLKMLKSEGGSALMIALFTVTLLMVAAMEIVYESNVEFLISSQQVNQIKAYYAAKSGVEISLLRIHIYKKALALFNDQIPDKSLLDMIWNTPFAWPPPVPESLNGVDKDAIKTSVKNSSMKSSSYIATVVSEGSKIDLNDLASPSTRIREATKKLVLQIFTSRIEADENGEDPWVKEHRDFNFEELVNNIADWVDSDEESVNGGPENKFYAKSEFEGLPPNRAFQSIDELHMVAGMTDSIFEVLAPKVTVFGTKAVNVNYCSKEILMALHPSITSEIADKIIESRNDPKRGPFKNIEDFTGFVTPLGVPNTAFVDSEGKATVPLAFDPELNFRIVSVGNAGKVSRKITAVVFDFDRAKTRLGKALREERLAQEQQQQQQTGQQQGQQQTGQQQQQGQDQKDQNKDQIKPPTDRPNIVYWLEE